MLLLPPLASAQAQQASPSNATTADKSAQTENATPGIPTFYAQSRQVILEAEVWEAARKKGDRPWIGNEPLTPGEREILLRRLHPPVRGLTPKDFHVFDNGAEQTINYFKETDLPAFDDTNHWYFLPEPGGMWGLFDKGPYFGIAFASYLIGYAPPAMGQGECHSIKVIAEGRQVELSRQRYCAPNSSESDEIKAFKGTKLGIKMLALANYPSTRGWINGGVQAFTFWSSGVLRLSTEAPPDNIAAKPIADYTYMVEVHDSEAPATVHIAIGGLNSWSWRYPCDKYGRVVHVLGMAYNTNGELAAQFVQTCTCELVANSEGRLPSRWFGYSGIYFPSRFDTQINLLPGDYDLRVVVSDEANFRRARIPLHIERFDPQSLMISDVVVAGVVRYAGWVLREAASVTPAPVVPARSLVRISSTFPTQIHLRTCNKGRPCTSTLKFTNRCWQTRAPASTTGGG